MKEQFDLFELLSNTLKPSTTLMELAAIWVEGQGRFAKGDKVYLDTSLESFTKDTLVYTHEVEKCMGTIGDSVLEITFKDLSDGELITIKIK